MNDATTIPRLDTAKAIANLGGDRLLYALVVQTFLDDLPNQFAVAEAGLGQGDYATSRRGAARLPRGERLKQRTRRLPRADFRGSARFLR